MCRPPPRFDSIDAAIPLTNQCKLISASLVGYPQILESMGVEKSARTPLELIVAPAIIYCTLGGINVSFGLRNNSSILLRR